jgi:hypothetical protein
MATVSDKNGISYRSIETDTKKYIFIMYVLMSYYLMRNKVPIAHLTNSHYFGGEHRVYL